MTQHARDTDRQRDLFTSAERVDLVSQLSAFGMKAAEITKKTRIPKADVTAAKTVAGSELAKKAADRYDFLTLEQATAVAEFDDDPEAVKRLAPAAQEVASSTRRGPP